MKTKICSVKTYFIILAVWGAVMSFMVPTWQTPDEEDHIAEICDAFGNREAADLIYEDVNLDAGRLRFHPEEKVDKGEWKAAMTAKPSYDRKDVMPKGLYLNVIKYLPAAIGVLVGVLLHLPTFWVMELAELSALAFYLLVCYLAVMRMPVKKEILMLFMALPMAMQQASSINYDGMLLPLSFLLIAYTTSLYLTEEKITWKHLLLFAGILLWITYIKIPYVIFGVLFFGLPFDRFELKVGKKTIDGDWIHRYRWVLRTLVVAIIAGGYYMVRGNDYVKLITIVCLEMRRTLVLLLQSLRNFGSYYAVSLVGEFGWIDSRMPTIFVVATYVLMVGLVIWNWRKKDGESFRKRSLIYMLLTFLLLSFFIAISMVNHTITMTLFGEERAFGSYDVREGLYQIPFIGGLQGRYFLPFFALPFVAVGKHKKQQKTVAENGVLVLYTLVAAVTTIGVLYIRYWI